MPTCWALIDIREAHSYIIQSMLEETPKPGKYRHYKGNHYEVIGLARHSETEEKLVVYRPLYGAGDLWVRPLEMFLEQLEVDGKRVDRFEFIESGPY